MPNSGDRRFPVSIHNRQKSFVPTSPATTHCTWWKGHRRKFSPTYRSQTCTYWTETTTTQSSVKSSIGSSRTHLTPSLSSTMCSGHVHDETYTTNHPHCPRKTNTRQAATAPLSGTTTSLPQGLV